MKFLQEHSLSLIKEIDQYGAAFKPSIKINQNEYKSIIGGLITLIKYGLSFTYLLYGIVLWLEGQVLPAIIVYDEILYGIEYKAEQNFILKYQHRIFQQGIDPFNNSAILIMALKIKQFSSQSSPISRERIDYVNGTLSLNDLDLKSNTNFYQYYSIIFTQFIASLLKSSEQCVSNETVNYFWNNNIAQFIESWLVLRKTFTQLQQKLMKESYFPRSLIIYLYLRCLKHHKDQILGFILKFSSPSIHDFCNPNVFALTSQNIQFSNISQIPQRSADKIKRCQKLEAQNPKNRKINISINQIVPEIDANQSSESRKEYKEILIEKKLNKNKVSVQYKDNYNQSHNSLEFKPFLENQNEPPLNRDNKLIIFMMNLILVFLYQSIQ